ncbi:hypothetical protein ABZ915_31665 [Streptomyces sp. NPDC046915]|uniref:hypothetical protein n=1 Tax=Streptomyces sp. NPDC046915 TaxID=3155257 RepID=UPI0034070ABC
MVSLTVEADGPLRMSVRAGKMGEEQYIRRTRGVQAVDGRTIKVGNTREMVLWWDAQVPDRLPWDGGQAA